tara:strand:- start:230 stop:433 length:204 start_codon:yes stop_codon:yes gene_type:complete
MVSAAGEVKKLIPQERMPTGFLSKNGPFLPVSNCEISFHLMIWNRWGQMVYAGFETGMEKLPVKNPF